jgi:UDP-N-acetylmuramate: L-alanyl-gamma-D-glutamyl-meso-diaminopimelate ligase
MASSSSELNQVEELLNQSEEGVQKRQAALRALNPGDHVYVAGICGTGTAAVASLLKMLGFKVSGSDKAFYPPMGDVVRAVADNIFEGYSADNLNERPDLVVIGNSLSKDHPEYQRVLADGIPYASMPEVLGELLVGSREDCKNSVVIAGTHGKTTTSAAMSVLLENAQRKPGYFVGGYVDELEGGIRPWSAEQPASERVVVLEGDEYDSACFAKWSKFHSYRPDFLVITSLEVDHADIFASIDDIVDEFEALVRSMPASAHVLICDQYQINQDLAVKWQQDSSVLCEVSLYGRDEKSKFRLKNRESGQGKQKLELELAGKKITVLTSLSGEHNALNLTAISSVACLLGLSESEIIQGVASFSGVKRRQQKVFDNEKIVVIEDFAHHPTAVDLTLAGLKELWPERRLVAVFEPRSNTSRRSFFQEAYAKSFSAADLVLIKSVAEDSGYSKSGEDIVALDTDQLVLDIKSNTGIEAQAISEIDSMTEELVSLKKEGDLIVLMSNGDFGGIKDKLIAKLS